MFRRYRQRRGPYALAQPSPVPSILRTIVLLLITAVILYFIGRGILKLFGVGSSEQRAAVTVMAEGTGIVNVSLEGGLLQRAADKIPLYAGDKVSSTSNGRARLSFFDGSAARSDINTELTIDESYIGEDGSEFSVAVNQGSLWIETPDIAIYSGTILRTITTAAFTLDLPADTQAVVSEKSLLVFSADGNGVGLTLTGSKEKIYIGEGQQLSLPENPGADALQYRSAIDPLITQRPFVVQSRAMAQQISSGTTASGATILDPTALIITSPADGAIASGTVNVIGKVGVAVDHVRINGHIVSVNKTDGSFTEEAALSDSAQTTLQIEAIDANDIVLTQVSRTVKRASQSAGTPTITSPAGNGQTYRTQAAEVEIRGNAPSGAAGIMVNDYKLQLFRVGDTTWSYLASKNLQNLVDGSNVFNVYALDAAGNPSAPATITVLIEQGTTGVVGGGSTTSAAASAASSAAAQIDEKTLPQNSPTTPGVITVTGPAAGTSFTATGSEILIEGTTSKQTAAIWVNGYKLQLYKAGQTYWNYIAKTDYGNFKRGTNVYIINARDSNNNILDTFTYTVTLNP